ncbi:glycosyltransferase [bacterium]|nr:glycosyltransferase [bacterium]
MSEPIISVVMPVYNSEKYLKGSVESILNQTFTDFEFIIVDDQSTDSSWQIIQEYANKDSRIVAVKNTGKKGCYPARNCGNRLAKGKYIAVMDSDDIALSKRLQTQFDFMEQNPDIDVCGSWAENFGTQNDIIKTPLTHSEIKDNSFFYCVMVHPTVIFINKGILYSEEYNSAQDYELYCRKINEFKFANIPEVLVLYRRHEYQISTSKKAEQDRNANEIRLGNLQNIGIKLSEKEQKVYCDFFSDEFSPKNIDELLNALNIFEKISTAGKNFGYGEYFQELIRSFQTKATNLGIENGITSLKLYFTTFRKMRFLDTPRTNLRYVFHCLKNIWS